MRFLLVDRIAEHVPDTSIRGWKNVAMAEDYLEWHFPERPIMPGVLILEACAQLAGWLEAGSTDCERWFHLDRVRSARYYDFAIPGDRIDITLTRVEDDDPERRVYRAETSVDGKRGASIEFEGRITALDDLMDRAWARTTWNQLRGEHA
mgnify:CR=1 FL=1